MQLKQMIFSQNPDIFRIFLIEHVKKFENAFNLPLENNITKLAVKPGLRPDIIAA